ncbi:MAG: DUF2892 domain-containing protein [Peptococcaceae bacterium]|nr:DUF2892 domain-containing protein [Peptococcaceae bacterium]
MRLGFKRNVGLRDQAVRIPFGIVLMASAVHVSSYPVFAAFLAVLAFFQLSSAVTQYCIIFDLAGWSTYRKTNVLGEWERK